MQKSVRSGIISVHDIHNKGIKLIIASLFLLLILMGGVGVVLFQSPLQESQDIRQQASSNEGVVKVTLEQSATPFLVNRTGVVSILANTGGLAIKEMTFLFNVVTDTFDTPIIDLAANSGLKVVASEVEQTNDGYLVSLTVQPVANSFRSTFPVSVAELVFTPHKPGNVAINFDVESSTAFRADEEGYVDELKTIAPVSYIVGTDLDLPTCTYTYGNWGACQNNFQRRSVLSKSPDNCFGDPVLQQSCQSNQTTSTTSINWETSHVKMTADNFYIVANGQKFNRPFTDLKLTSDPAGDDNDKYTTLEAIWNENNTEMRLFMYFKHDGTDWWSNEMRIYNGANPGNWITFTQGVGDTVSYQKQYGFFTTKLKDTFNRTGVTRYTTSGGGIGEIHFENLKLQAFTKYGTGGYTVKQCNESCSSNAECGVNQRCYSNRCRLVTNVSSETCTGPADNGLQRQCNQYCADSRECGSGLSCYYNRCRRADNPDSQSCAQLSGSARTQTTASCNQNCSSNADCAVNLRCYKGQCRLTTNPSSTTCSVASSGSVSQPNYGTKGGTQTGTGTVNPSATPTSTPSGSIIPTGTPSSTATPSATPISSLLPTPTPTSTPEPQPENSSLDSIVAVLASRGITLPLIAALIGGILLLILLLILISRILGRKQTPPTPPRPTNTPQMKNLEQKIADLQKQQTPGLAPQAPQPVGTPVTPASVPVTVPLAAPASIPTTPAPLPRPTVPVAATQPTQPRANQPIQPVRPVQPVQAPRPNVPAQPSQTFKPAQPVKPVQHTQTQPQPQQQAQAQLKPVQPKPVQTPFKPQPQQPKPLAPAAKPALLPKSDDLALPAQAQPKVSGGNRPQVTQPNNQPTRPTQSNQAFKPVPPVKSVQQQQPKPQATQKLQPAPKPAQQTAQPAPKAEADDDSPSHHSSMMARIRAKGLVKDKAGNTEIFSGQTANPKK